MSKIESLTVEQESRFQEFVDKWTGVGLCTDPANRQRAENGIIVAYQAANLLPPQRIVWCKSPVGNSLARVALARDSIGASVGASVRDSVRNSVRASVYGQHEAGGLSFYDYFRMVCGLEEETERLQGISEVAQSAGWWLPCENICWVSERHNILVRDGEGRLHCENGPAISYPDGWSIHAWHGVHVPEAIITRPEIITVRSINGEANAEIRRVMLERYGEGRYLEDTKASLIHEDDTGILYRSAIANDEPLVMVRVIDASTQRPYFLRVPPDMDRARQAVAWTFDVDEKEYQPTREA